MTQEEADLLPMIKIKGRDIIPNRYSILCTFEGSKEICLNGICSTRPMNSDSNSLWCMLDSHNFMKVGLDEEIEVIDNDKALAMTQYIAWDWAI